MAVPTNNRTPKRFFTVCSFDRGLSGTFALDQRVRGSITGAAATIAGAERTLATNLRQFRFFMIDPFVDRGYVTEHTCPALPAGLFEAEHWKWATLRNDCRAVTMA